MSSITVPSGGNAADAATAGKLAQVDAKIVEVNAAIAGIPASINTIVRVSAYEYGLRESNTAAEANTAFLAAASAAVAQRKTLIVNPGTYTLNPATLSTAARLGPLAIELPSGAELIIPDGNSVGLNVSGTLDGPYALDAATIGANSITVTGGTWAAGDYALLGSDDVWDNAGYADVNTVAANYSGEYVRVDAVEAVGGGKFKLYLRGPLACVYSTNPYANKANLLKGFSLTGAGSIRGATQAGRTGDLITVSLALSPLIAGLLVSNGAYGAVTGQGNIQARYDALTLTEMLNSPYVYGNGINQPPTGGLGAYGYGLVLRGPETAPMVTSLAVRNARHGITTGNGESMGSGRHGTARGVVRDLLVNGMTAEYTTSTAIDTHSQTDGAVFTDITLRGCYGGIGHRGRNILTSNFSLTDCYGTGLNVLSSGRNIVFANGKVTRMRATPTPLPTGWGSGNGVAVALPTDATYGNPKNVQFRNLELTENASHGMSCSIPDVQLQGVRANGNGLYGVLLNATATGARLTDCQTNDNGVIGLSTNLTATGAILTRHEATGNAGVGLELGNANILLIDPRISGNDLSRVDSTARRDIKFPTGGAYIPARGGLNLPSLRSNPTLSVGTQTAATGFAPFAAGGVTVTANRLISSAYYDGVAYRVTSTGDVDYGYETTLEAGIVYTLATRGQAETGVWTAQVLGPRDQASYSGQIALTLPATALSSGDLTLQGQSFTVPVTGTYRITVSGVLGGNSSISAIVDALAVQAGQGRVFLPDDGAPFNRTFPGDYIWEKSGSIAAWRFRGDTGLGVALDDTNATTAQAVDLHWARKGISLWSGRLATDGTWSLIRRSAAGSFLDEPIKVNAATGYVQFIGTYTAPLLIGTLRLWNNAGALMFKTSSPASITDGDALVTTASAATTGTRGAVFRAAALTAAAVPSTALTASATYTQAEITAIIARVELLRLRLADLEAKQTTAGQLT